MHWKIYIENNLKKDFLFNAVEPKIYIFWRQVTEAYTITNTNTSGLRQGTEHLMENEQNIDRFAQKMDKIVQKRFQTEHLMDNLQNY